ncbi:MAG: ATP-binding cassette domain-containing protein [Pseudomonadales bacterium]|nr:ATP-binding cassette domain-containing protein [Pseudomonadales bacterium]
MTINQERLSRIANRQQADQTQWQYAVENFNTLIEGRSHLTDHQSDAMRIALFSLCESFQRKLPLHINTDLTQREAVDIASDAGLIAREINLAKLDNGYAADNAEPGLKRLQQDLGPLLIVERETAEQPQKAWAAIRRRGRYQASPAVDAETGSSADFFNNKIIYSVSPKLPNQALSLKQWLVFGTSWLKPEIGLFALLTLAASALAMTLPMLTSGIIDTVVPNNQPTLLLQISLLLLLVVSFQGISHFMLSWVQCRMDIKNDNILQTAIIDRVLLMAAQNSTSPSMLAMQTQSAIQCRKAMHSAAMLMVNGSSYLVAASALMLVYQTKAALIVLLGIVVLLCLLVGLGLKRQQALQEGQLQDMSSNDKLFDMLANISMIRSFGLETHFFSQWANNYSIMRGKLLRAKSVFNIIPALEKSWPYLLLTLGYGAAALGGEVQPQAQGQFLGFITALATATSGVSLLSAGLQQLFTSLPMSAAFKPVLQFIPKPEPAALTPSLNGAISVSHLSLSYPGAERAALSDINLDIAAGEYIGIVGASGSGKSSLILALLGLHTADKGSILFDGHHLDTLHQPSLRRQIAMVMQGQQLLPGSLFDNIAGLRTLSLSDAWLAAEQAMIADDIRQLPMGMFTMVGDLQAVFSGGQIQRLLLARALAANNPILLLDEATSALDKSTQSQICRNLATLSNTRIVIAHRLATVQLCDRIVVMHNGKIDALGSWSELAKHSQRFQQLLAHEQAV